MTGAEILKSCGLLFEGDARLLDGPRRALLISRTERRVVPVTPWVRRIVLAAQLSAQADEALVCGAERVPHLVALAACRHSGGAAIAILQRAPEEAWLQTHEDILPARRVLVWPGPGYAQAVADPVPWRDALLAELADRAWSVQIRKGGHMQAVAERLRARGHPVEAAPLSDAPAPDTAPAVLLPDGRKSEEPNPREWPYLTHYTREPDGAWPDESPSEYAQWLALGPWDARREAFDTLLRILASRRLLAGKRLLPRGEPMLCFTARAPWELNRIVRWRRGLRRWTIRPYGLAIRREVLQALGAQPVRYLPPAELKALTPNARLYAQRHAPPQTDWSGEAEWRLHGDLELDRVPREMLRVLVPTLRERQVIQERWGVEAQVIGP